MIRDKVLSAYKWELEQSSHQDHEINETPPPHNHPSTSPIDNPCNLSGSNLDFVIYGALTAFLDI